MKRICIVGISGKLGQFMATHALDRGYEVVGVCRPESVGKLAAFGDRIRIVPGRTTDEAAVGEAVKGCDGVLTVLIPWGMDRYASRTARAVLRQAEPGARLVFSAGWHIRHSPADRYRLGQRLRLRLLGRIAALTRMADLADHVEAARLVFASDTAWTLVRGSDLEDGESEGLPVWAPYVGHPMLASNHTRRTDFALFMVHALTDDDLLRQAPAIVSRASASARAHRQARDKLSA